MNLIDMIRREVAITGEVRRACDRWHELDAEYYRHPCHSPERRAVGAEIAGCLNAIANGLGWAKLPRLVASFDPDDLRRDMERWRDGDDMSGEETCPHGTYGI